MNEVPGRSGQQVRGAAARGAPVLTRAARRASLALGPVV